MALTVESGVVPAQAQNRLRHDAVSFPETLAQSVAAASVLTAGAVAMALRRRRREAWAAMGAVFE